MSSGSRNNVYRVITFCKPIFAIWALFDMMSERMGISSLYSLELKGRVCARLRVGDGVLSLMSKRIEDITTLADTQLPHSSLVWTNIFAKSQARCMVPEIGSLKTCFACVLIALNPFGHSLAALHRNM